MINQRFGRLVVLSEIKERSRDRHIMYKCLCDCGSEHITTGRALRHTTKSCGCIRVEKLYKPIKATDHPLYTTWMGMRGRCLNKNNPKYINYGGRGITIDESWNDFYTFANDMGDRPLNHTLDRIDNSGNYSKNNCKWSSHKEQANNRRKRSIVKMH